MVLLLLVARYCPVVQLRGLHAQQLLLRVDIVLQLQQVLLQLLRLCCQGCQCRLQGLVLQLEAGLLLLEQRFLVLVALSLHLLEVLQ